MTHTTHCFCAEQVWNADVFMNDQAYLDGGQESDEERRHVVRELTTGHSVAVQAMQ